MIPLNDKNDRMTLIREDGGLSFYEYRPTPFRLLYRHFEKMTLSRRIRLLLEYFAKGKYKVFYLLKDGVPVGPCVVAAGNRRLKMSSQEDIVLGPYFVDPAFRGNGYAKLLISAVLRDGGLSYRYAYDYIKKSNIPSIKATLANGFTLCGELDIEGFFHKLTEREGGDYNIYRYDPSGASDI